ncbi:MAG: T9SS type A sorting domain-containing protein [Ferruginibacter sp.]
MKNIILAFLVLCSFTSKAQIVYIPDPNFKYALTHQTGYDVNGDGEIDVNEALLITLIDLDALVSDVTGINSFANLSWLRLVNNPLTFLDLNGLNNLTHIECVNNNPLTTVSINNLPLLNDMAMSNLNTTTVDISNVPALRVASIGGKITSINIPALSGVTSLTLRGDFTTLDLTLLHSLNSLTLNANLLLTEFNVQALTNLLTISANDCPVLSSINLHNCIGLKNLYIGNNPALTSLTLTGHNLFNIEWVNVNSCGLTTIGLVGCNTLKRVYASHNQLTAIDLTGLTNLISLWVDYNAIPIIDASPCLVLTDLNVEANTPLYYINIKNGPVATLPSSPLTPNLRYVCVEDAEIAYLLQYYIQGRPEVNINSYCSFFPGGSYNTIRGKVRADLNSNGCDVTDPVLPGISVKMVSGASTFFTTADSTGEYTFYTNTGIYTITVQPANSYFNITPASSVINFTTTNNTQIFDFCLAPTGSHPDVDVTIIPQGNARPGFYTNYQVMVKNKGASALSGNVTFNYLNNKMIYANSTPTATQTPGQLDWTYSNLLPQTALVFNCQFVIFPPPINNVNDTLTFSAQVTPLAGDETPADNNFVLRQAIRGSYDPNDKSSSEADTISLTHIGDYMHYVIRFQNTGTDTAFNVVVKDLLSTKLDWNTFQLIKASHPCVVNQSNGNKLEFIFQNINLPDSNINEPGSHGFVAFKVKTIGTMSVGDTIKNDASIYFDFNLPVITNTIASVIVPEVIIPISIEYFKGAVQAGKNYLNWKAACTSTQAVFNIERSSDGSNFISISNITASNTRCLQPFDLTDEHPMPGMNYYRIKMTDVDGKLTYSIVIALLNKNTGFEILSLAPNPVLGGTATLNITSANIQQINIIVTDASGKTIYTVKQQAIAGSSQVDLNFLRLSAGIYSVSIMTAEGEKKSIKFVKE